MKSFQMVELAEQGNIWWVGAKLDDHLNPQIGLDSETHTGRHDNELSLS